MNMQSKPLYHCEKDRTLTPSGLQCRGERQFVGVSFSPLFCFAVPPPVFPSYHMISYLIGVSNGRMAPSDFFFAPQFFPCMTGLVTTRSYRQSHFAFIPINTSFFLYSYDSYVRAILRPSFAKLINSTHNQTNPTQTNQPNTPTHNPQPNTHTELLLYVVEFYRYDITCKYSVGTVVRFPVDPLPVGFTNMFETHYGWRTLCTRQRDYS